MINFKKYAQKGEAFVNEVASELGQPEEKAKAARIMRSVLHAFRDHLTPAESLQMVSQLPMMIKAIYVDGWKISSGAPRSRSVSDFIEEVRKAGGTNSNHDFTSNQDVLNAIHAVLRVVKNHVSEGEIDDIIFILPAELRPFLTEA